MPTRPIIFDEHSVSTILAGQKTQTRRVAKGAATPLPNFVKNPYGVVGDVLWVKEAHWIKNGKVAYQDPRADDWQKRNALFMPRALSRLTLAITEYRLEHLQDATDEDIVAEGVTVGEGETMYEGKLLELWIHRWDSINAKRGYSWESNPVVHVVSFEIHHLERKS